MVRTDNRKLLVSYSSGSVVVFDYMAEKAVSQFSGVADTPNPTHNPDKQINQVRPLRSILHYQIRIV